MVIVDSMKLYRVTISDYGSYGPRGMTHAGTGLTTWAFTDKLQILSTPKTMTTELWIQAIVDGEVPYTIDSTIRHDKVSQVRLIA